MSLKSFHVVFIAASILLCAILAAWCFQGYRQDGETSQLAWAALAAAGGVGLAVYEWVFLKKHKHISYL
ncbi:MAG TPA: hypothetical protein VMF06_09515 [Candidatus Limnocylindria bacterium]|jgi:hypothetical protein|nr:hypothetical protein [Candidatus Limnocylindria bacterium]